MRIRTVLRWLSRRNRSSTEFTTSRGEIVAFGGGVGGNTFGRRSNWRHVFVPKNDFVANVRDGLEQAEAIAEQIARCFVAFVRAAFRRFDVSVQPGGDGAI